MPNVFIVIGNQDAGKSSLIRCLTGLSKRRDDPWRVATEENPNMPIFVLISALQEDKNHPMTPPQFIQEVNRNRYENVLVPLRISGKKKGFPDCYEYIDAFHNAEGWRIIQIVVLGEGFEAGRLPAGTPDPGDTVDPLGENPANQNASHVRHRWGWV